MPGCPHARTRLVAKDKDAEYIECLDCGAVLEAEELNALSAAKSPEEKSAQEKPAPEKQGPEGPASETLSDA